MKLKLLCMAALILLTSGCVYVTISIVGVQNRSNTLLPSGEALTTSDTDSTGGGSVDAKLSPLDEPLEIEL